MNPGMLLLAVMSAVRLANVDTAKSCDIGWFGKGCRYRCHCTTNGCNSDGTCTTCRERWFGPACQYDDLAFHRKTRPYTQLLTDAYDDTCLSSRTFQGNNVTIMLDNKYLFTWLRVHVRATAKDLLHHFQVFFGPDASSPCMNPRNASLGETTLDVHCGMDAPVQDVTLRGDAVPHLCSVYISGGRNIALRQNTSQSSTYSDYYGSNAGNKAVDGYGKDGLFSYCSSTLHEWTSSRAPHWNVTFDLPRYTTRYVLYNRDGASDRLQKFYLQSFGEMNERVFHYTDKDPTVSQKYTVVPDSVTSPVTRVSIQANNSEQILTLCEVEIYGDSSCGIGKYGRDCELNCWCSQKEECFASTGGCPSGCAPGFRGESCHTECPIGLYGSACANNCSQFCVPSNSSLKSPCHHVSGVCNLGCQASYTGTTCTTLTSAGSDDGIGLVAGVVVCALVILCLATLGIFLVRKRRLARGDQPMQFKTKTEEIIYESIKDSNPHVNDAGIERASPHRTTGSKALGSKAPGSKAPGSKAPGSKAPGSKAPGSKAPAPKQVEEQQSQDSTQDSTRAADSDPVYNNMAAVPSSTRLSLSDLPHVLKTQDRRVFETQFHQIPNNEAATTTVGTSPENRLKNRYKNICTYDHSRVHLLADPDKNLGDYINASFVQGYRSDERFIAAQGATKVILEDFIRMLWEQEVDKVVMLTNLVEDGKQKCERYWPEDGEMKVGEIRVSLTTTQVFADYTIRRLQLKKNDQPIQNVTQFHFTAWPDRDVPTCTWGLVDFEQKVASYPTDKPIVVHCSAGVGRTGTFIALRNVMREAEETGHVDFFTAVQKLRQDRINMVQTVDQYIFLHRAALVAMLCIGTTVTAKDFRGRVRTLETSGKSGQTKMEAEFQAICCACDDDLLGPDGSLENPCQVYHNAEGGRSGRDSSIVANLAHRAILARETDEVDDYINAVLVPSLAKQNQHILTQLPRSSTITDFWRLVTQYRVSVIVAFQTDLITQDQTLGQYLPASDDQPLELSMFTVRTEPGPSSVYWKHHNVVVNIDRDKIVNMSAVKADEHKITHLACRPQNMDPAFLLALVETMRSLRSAQSRRVLYCCRDGATYCGLACVLSLLLDRLDTDHRLTIPLVVGALKAIRPQIVPTLDQYRLLYDVLLQYSENATEYSNIGSCVS